MGELLQNIDSAELRACISDAHAVAGSGHTEEAQNSGRLTLASLISYADKEQRRAGNLTEDDNEIRNAVVRTGVSLFGPMFSAKNANVPAKAIMQELDRQGYLVQSLRHFNQAQLNLFFMSLKESGLVTDKYFSGYMCYST